MAALPPIDPKEMARLEREWGPCARLEYDVLMSPSSLDYWLKRVPKKRRGEVGMLILGPEGKALIHTKPHYPEGTFRIPTGGIKPRERVLAALRREAWEETGLNVAVERLLAVLDYRFTDGGRELRFATYLFLLRSDGGEPTPQDEDEQIAEFRQTDLRGLCALAESLEGLAGQWSDWGRFRALAHRAAAQVLGGKT
jgi:8-oxo-dGTP pyrophosphatase MutT (NUDIX family)